MMLTIDKPSLLINWSPFDYVLKNNLSIILPKILKKKIKFFLLRIIIKFILELTMMGLIELKT